MIAFEVTADGKRVCLAGAGEHGVMTIAIGWVGSSAEDGNTYLHISGLDSSTDEHLDWEVPEIAVGSTVVVRVVEAAEVDVPKSRARHDLDSNPAQYRRNLFRLGGELSAEERKQLLQELIAQLEALG